MDENTAFREDRCIMCDATSYDVICVQGTIFVLDQFGTRRIIYCYYCNMTNAENIGRKMRLMNAIKEKKRKSN